MPSPVRGRPLVSDQGGMLMIELVVAMAILAVALLALMAGYDSAFVSMHATTEQSVAATLANAQLERYRALPYASIGLDAATTAAVGDSSNPAYDSLYATNSILAGAWVVDPTTGQLVQQPSGTVNDVTISGCGSTPSCEPIQTVSGPDGRTYRIETFVRDDVNDASNIRWTTRDVTVIVRDPTTDAQLVELATGFDRAAAG